MTDPTASWSEDESRIYRDIARYAVPERERQIGLMTALVGAAAGDGPVLDLCCGEGYLSEALLRALPETAVLAFDGSTSMLDATVARCGGSDRLTTRAVDLAESSWRRFEEPLRAVVSSLAVHHLDDAGKRDLFADLHAALAPGGAFILADIVRPATRVGHAIAATMWDEEVRRRSMDLDGDLSGFDAFRRADWNHFRHEVPDPIDRPATVVEQMDWLRAAGFTAVDLHWMIAGHVVLSGWKR